MMKDKILVTFSLFFFFSFSIVWGQRESGLSASIGFKGTVVPGRWMPVVISSDAPVNGLHVVVSRKNEDGMTVTRESLAFRGGKRIESSFLAEDLSGSLELQLFDEKRLFSTKTFHPGEQIFPGNVVLTIGVPSGAEQAVHFALSPWESVLTVPLEAEELPSLAVNYDGISAVLMNDPGPVLSPSQIQALKNWVSGGGNLTVFEVKAESFLPDIIEGSLNFRERASIPWGEGRINVLDKEIGTMKPGEMKILLGLTPFGESTRLTPGVIFPPRLPLVAGADQNSRFLMFFKNTALFLAAWAAGFIALFGFKKKKPLWIAGYTLFCVVAGGLIAFPVSGNWRRGASVSVLALALPESLIVNVQVSAFPNPITNAQIYKVSPWKIPLSLGRGEKGFLHGGTNASWEHLQEFPSVYLKKSDRDSTTLISWLNLKNADWESGIVYLWKDRTLYQRGTKAENPADWGNMDTWLNWLSDRYPGRNWLIGRGNKLPLNLSIMKSGVTKFYYVMPGEKAR